MNVLACACLLLAVGCTVAQYDNFPPTDEWRTKAIGGVCPNPYPAVQQNFDIARYMGKWYEYVRFPNVQEGYSVNSRCVNANYTLNADGTVGVVNRALNPRMYFGIECPRLFFKQRELAGVATIPDNNNAARLRVQFNPRAAPGDLGGMYDVLETDYVSYAVVYSCDENATENMWILTRGKLTAPPADYDAIIQRIRDAKINPDNFVLADNEGCQD